MRVAVFSTKPYDREHLAPAAGPHELLFLEARLDSITAALAEGKDAVCCFVNDDLSGPVLEQLATGGTRLVALRSAGYNHVDLVAAHALGLTVGRVPAYSPHAVAEHTVGLVLALNRKIHRAYNRVRDGNFALHGLVGFDLHRRTVGIVGTGAIGTVLARIMTGFGCRVLAHDPAPSGECEALGVRYVGLDELLAAADVVTLHCPLTPGTQHLIDADALARMRPGAMLVNTSRGGLVDTPAVIDALKSGALGALALDAYEEEAELFFEDLSERIITDDVFMRLLTFPNVLVTSHQAFLTEDALAEIAAVTIGNITAFETGDGTLHRVPPPVAAAG